MSKERISNGYGITVQKKTTLHGAPTTIYLHKLGGDESTWLTIPELEAFIHELQDALDEARKP